jgi:hypothetical protein
MRYSVEELITVVTVRSTIRSCIVCYPFNSDFRYQGICEDNIKMDLGRIRKVWNCVRLVGGVTYSSTTVIKYLTA